MKTVQERVSACDLNDTRLEREMQKERERKRETEKERQEDRERERQSERERARERERERKKERKKERQRERQKEREREKKRKQAQVLKQESSKFLHLLPRIYGGLQSSDEEGFAYAQACAVVLFGYNTDVEVRFTQQFVREHRAARGGVMFSDAGVQRADGAAYVKL